MLLNLHIKNMALIDDANIDFGDKLNILTGETGAGKSIIIGSVNIALGGVFPKDMVRDEAIPAIVELLFLVEDLDTRKALSNIGIEPSEDNELVISRRLQNGRVINKINDDTVTVTKLKEISEILIDIHGQHDNQTLLKTKNHIMILDQYGDAIAPKVAKVSEIYNRYEEILKEIEDNKIDEEERLRQIDFIRYEVSEIENAHITKGEIEELELRYKKMKNSKDIIENASSVYNMTSGKEESASELISKAYRDMSVIEKLDEDSSNMASMLLDIDNLLNEFNVALSDYMGDMSFEEEEYREVEARLDLINSLKIKYGKTLSDINEYLQEKLAILKKYEEYDAYMEGLRKALKEVEDRLEKASSELSKLRKSEAKKLCKDITIALEDLNFLDVRFDMMFEKTKGYTKRGYDAPYFVISTNVGEDMKPLTNVASGGELSRIMLAIKSTLAHIDKVDTLIFDEIDAGISGKTAQKVAEKLSLLSRSHQIICITHLPQIASMADTHFIIEKAVEKDKTITSIAPLDEEYSIQELARLLGGVSITDNVLNSAREMKDMANKTKIH